MRLFANTKMENVLTIHCPTEMCANNIPSGKKPPAEQNFLLDKSTGEVCECVRAKSVRLVSHVTGKVHFVRCKTYKCTSCGTAKKIKIQQKLQEFLDTCDYVRMWTFTISSKFSSLEENAKLWSVAWRRFVTELRRCDELNAVQKKVSYFRVAEIHKSGYIHYHVCLNKFLPVGIIRALWRKCVAYALGYYPQNAFANVNIKLITESKTAAKYVSKYLEKGIAAEEYNDILRTSKSRDIPAFFPKKISVAEYVCLNEKDAFMYALYVRNMKEKAFANLEYVKNDATNFHENVSYMPLELQLYYADCPDDVDFYRYLE